MNSWQSFYATLSWERGRPTDFYTCIFSCLAELTASVSAALAKNMMDQRCFVFNFVFTTAPTSSPSSVGITVQTVNNWLIITWHSDTVRRELRALEKLPLQSFPLTDSLSELQVVFNLIMTGQGREFLPLSEKNYMTRIEYLIWYFKGINKYMCV